MCPYSEKPLVHRAELNNRGRAAVREMVAVGLHPGCWERATVVPGRLRTASARNPAPLKKVEMEKGKVMQRG